MVQLSYYQCTSVKVSFEEGAEVTKVHVYIAWLPYIAITLI